MKPQKVLVTAFTLDEQAVRLLENSGFEIVYPQTRPVLQEELIALIRDADAYIAGSEKIDSRLLDHAGKLKLISRMGVGYDAVDWKYAAGRGITTTVTAGTLDQSVAEMVFALLLGLARRIPFFHHETRGGNWVPHLLGHEIWHKTLGIIGTGKIGKAVARRAKAFEMDVVVYDPYRDLEWAQKTGVRYAELDELIPSSDFITLHAPVNETTENMVSASFLGQMKPTACLINTARGKLIDEEALYHALAEGRIAGAALDVYQTEPCASDNKLFQLDNCLFTCHISSHTYEAMLRMSLMCAEEVIRSAKGEPPLHPLR